MRPLRTSRALTCAFHWIPEKRSTVPNTTVRAPKDEPIRRAQSASAQDAAGIRDCRTRVRANEGEARPMRRRSVSMRGLARGWFDGVFISRLGYEGQQRHGRDRGHCRQHEFDHRSSLPLIRRCARAARRSAHAILTAAVQLPLRGSTRRPMNRDRDRGRG